MPPSETGVTLFAGEAPRLVVDQLAREPEALCASARAGAGVRRAPAAAARLRRAAGRRPRARPHLPRGGLVRDRRPAASCSSGRTARPASSCAGRAGSPRGSSRSSSPTPTLPVPKFAAPDRILLAYAGGDAGLFSMVFGGWVAGEIGSGPGDRGAWSRGADDPRPHAERDPRAAARAARCAARRRRSRSSTSASRAAMSSSTSSRRCCARAATRSARRPSRRSPSPRRATCAARSPSAATRSSRRSPTEAPACRAVCAT